MADIVDKKTRSYIMSRIGAKNTKPEITVRKYLHAHGFRFRIHVKNLPGTPDIVLPKYKTTIMVHGCFWHGHEDCKYSKLPATRKDWWQTKVNKTKERDKQKERALRELGWNVITLHECQLKKASLETEMDKVVDRLQRILDA